VEGFRDPHVHYSQLLRSNVSSENARALHRDAGGRRDCVRAAVLASNDVTSARAFPLISLYIMATWRLVPALANRLQRFRGNSVLHAALQRIHGELTTEAHDLVDHSTSAFALQQNIRLRGVGYAYPDAAAQADET